MKIGNSRVDPADKETSYALSETFKRAGTSLGYDTNTRINSPVGAVRYSPSEDMTFEEMKSVLDLVAHTLNTQVAVSTTETLSGEDIRFHSFHDPDETAEYRKQTQNLAMSGNNLILTVAP